MVILGWLILLELSEWLVFNSFSDEVRQSRNKSVKGRGLDFDAAFYEIQKTNLNFGQVLFVYCNNVLNNDECLRFVT